MPLIPTEPRMFERVALYPGRFDPPTKAHVAIIEALLALRFQENGHHCFDRVYVWPIRAYSGHEERAPNDHRIEMVKLAFQARGVNLVFTDLRRESGFTSNYRMQVDLSSEPLGALRDDLMVPLGMPLRVREIWHVIGADNVDAIRAEWNEADEMWRHARFLIVPREGANPAALPPKHDVLHVDTSGHWKASRVTEAIKLGNDAWREHVPEAVADYIETHNLYR